MQPQTIALIHRLSQQIQGPDEIPFPQVIAALIEVGIVRYYTDMISGRKIYYHQDGTSYIHEASFEPLKVTTIAFNQQGVIQALKAIQSAQISYLEFLKRIAESGCVYYTVFIQGKQVHYVSHTGEMYVEPFPGKPI